MASLVRANRRSPEIRTFTAQLVSDNAQKDFAGEIATVFDFVQNHIRYVLDINNVETVQTPGHTLLVEYGDCDDKAVLLATMLESIGHACKFMAIATENPGEYNHVFVQTLYGTDWVSLDPTEPNGVGWEPPDILTWLEWWIG